MNTQTHDSKQWFLIRIISIIILVGILFAVSSMHGSPSVTDTTPSPKTFSVITKSEKTDFYTLDAQYPSDPLDRDNLISSWAETIINKTKNDWKTGGELQLSEAQLSAEFPDRPAMQYSRSIDYTQYNSMKLGTVSYVMQNYEFTGGAHGNTGLQTFTFNQNGRINLTDILTITSSNAQKLTDSIRNKLTETLGDMADHGMIRDGLDCQTIVEDNTSGQYCGHEAIISNLGNFYITDEGVTFIFGQYQVAAYAAGMPEVTLSWSELASFMNPGFELPLE
jgi:hypothetical protein